MHGLIGWGVPFLDDKLLWERFRVSPDDPFVNVPSPEDALLITIAHAFYENKSFKLLDLVRIRYCLKQKNFDFELITQIAKRRGWSDGLAFALILCSHLEMQLYGETCVPSEVLDSRKGTHSLFTLVEEGGCKRC